MAQAYPTVLARASAAVPEAAAAEGRRAVSAYLAWTPGLWLMGLHVAAVPPLTAWLCARRWPTSPAANLIFGAWMLAAAGQLVSALYNSALASEGLLGMAGRSFALNIVGWAFVGFAVAAGASHAMGGAGMVRSLMRLGVSIGLIGVACLALSKLAGGGMGLTLPTPVSAVIGDRPMLNAYTTLSLFLVEEWLPGIPRQRMFFPWATGLGFAGVCIALAACLERDRAWQAAGAAGALVAIVASGSRNAFVVLPLSLAAVAAFRYRGPVVTAALAAALTAAVCFSVAGVNPVTLAGDALDALKESRAGSSVARDMIYDYSFRGFLDSPLFGKGWVGESIIWQEDIPIGSHSTFYGTLYTGGLSAFVPLVLATLATLGALSARALRERSLEAAVGAAMMAAMVVFSYQESIYSLILPCIYVFLFIGGTLVPNPPEAA